MSAPGEKSDAEAADPGEVAAVDTYSARPYPPAVGHGATVDLHDGSRMFINHVR